MEDKSSNRRCPKWIGVVVPINLKPLLRFASLLFVSHSSLDEDKDEIQMKMLEPYGSARRTKHRTQSIPLIIPSYHLDHLSLLQME